MLHNNYDVHAVYEVPCLVFTHNIEYSSSRRGGADSFDNNKMLYLPINTVYVYVVNAYCWYAGIVFKLM